MLADGMSTMAEIRNKNFVASSQPLANKDTAILGSLGRGNNVSYWPTAAADCAPQQSRDVAEVTDGGELGG